MTKRVFILLSFCLLMAANARLQANNQLQVQDPKWGVEEAHAVCERIKWPKNLSQSKFKQGIGVYFKLSQKSKVSDFRSDRYFPPFMAGLSKREFREAQNALCHAIRKTTIRIPEVSGGPPFWVSFFVTDQDCKMHVVIAPPIEKLQQ